jgi:hypothetical protein
MSYVNQGLKALNVLLFSTIMLREIACVNFLLVSTFF